MAKAFEAGFRNLGQQAVGNSLACGTRHCRTPATFVHRGCQRVHRRLRNGQHRASLRRPSTYSSSGSLQEFSIGCLILEEEGNCCDDGITGNVSQFLLCTNYNGGKCEGAETPPGKVVRWLRPGWKPSPCGRVSSRSAGPRMGGVIAQRARVAANDRSAGNATRISVLPARSSCDCTISA